MFLAEAISDLHLVKGATDSTMSHGEGWRFMTIGVHIERAQLMGRLLKVCFHNAHSTITEDHTAMVSLLRMACALEPYLRAYTADLNAESILEFLLFDEDFPRSIHFSTSRIANHLDHLSRGRDAGRGDPRRVAARLNARLAYADIDEVESAGVGALLDEVEAGCSAINQAVHDTFVSYPLELRLPA